MSIWSAFLLNALIFFYKILGHNLGLAIIALTMVIRALLLPLTLPSLKSAQKIKDLAPALKKLKEKYKKDKQKLAKAQLELYQQHGINPARGCLPQIIQIIILFALYQAFNQVLRPNENGAEVLNQVLYPFLHLKNTSPINTNFLYLDLTEPDFISLPFKLSLLNFTISKIPGLFLLAAALTQFFASKQMMPGAKKMEERAKKTPQQEDDMAAAMQTQMLYFMPLMTLFIGFRFPSGLVLYWLTFSLFMIIQQLIIKKSQPRLASKAKKKKGVN